MISSIFGKTKPVNYIIILAFLFSFYWLELFFLSGKTYSLDQLLPKILGLAVLLFSIFLVNFIIKRNKMTGPNSFAILFYALLMVVFPETMTDNNAILCSFFLLLATRRLISIRSLRNIKLKVFDATLWIMVSSLFYYWAVLYLLLVLAAIYIYEPKNIRNWMVPFVGTIAFLMITYCILILANNNGFLIEHYEFNFNLNLAYFMDWGNSSRLILYVLLTFLATLYSFLKLGKSGLGKIVTMRFIVLSFSIGIFLKILVSATDTHPLMVTFFPAVIFMTNYVESIKKDNTREIVLIASLFVPFLVLISNWIIH